MRALVQRVAEASVSVDNVVQGSIGRGLLLLIGIGPDDTIDDRRWLARKIVQLRVFEDDDGVMNRSVQDIGGEILAVSQFTLFASTRNGNRPSYAGAARPEIAEPALDALVDEIEALLAKPVPTGVFGAMMKVALVNDGPVTIWLDSRMRE
ncbi:MAG TPA: D-aminoacyl-tRNA deacylase [Casimicrobiaceae bacterium]|nr:D-aminoacyl-tRNA deacylase [Casimicrobiaceae bacterium]